MIYGSGTSKMTTLEVAIIVSYYRKYSAKLSLLTIILYVFKLTSTITSLRIAFYGVFDDISKDISRRANQDCEL